SRYGVTGDSRGEARRAPYPLRRHRQRDRDGFHDACATVGKNSGQMLRLNRMNIRKIAAVVVMAVIGTWSADAASTNDGRSPAGPQFTNFKDGDTVSNPVIVRFTSDRKS